MTKPLPKFLEDLIAHPPAAGSGIHDWMFDCARNLHAHLPAGEIENLIRSRVSNCGRVVPDREIKDAVKRSIDFSWQPKGSAGSSSPVNAPSKPDLQKIERLVVDGWRTADLWHNSPYWFEEPACEYIIDRLFPGNPLLCCGRESFKFDTKPREEWRGTLTEQSFIVPSPMSNLTGLTQDGKESAHTLDNTGPRRFLVVEFDFSEYGRDGKKPTVFQPMLARLNKMGITVHDMCANLLLRLNEQAAMTLAVNSGGKSIHGWWYCENVPEDKLRSFHNYAITLGADPRLWLKSQFCRMPDGTRQNGKPQPVYYFNPDTLPKS
jgi:hypothetical protein